MAKFHNYTHLKRAAKAKASLCIGINLADNQQDDSIDVVYESFVSFTRAAKVQTSLCIGINSTEY